MMAKRESEDININQSAPASMEPIFIVGCQRSGTTFLGSLLGADPASIAIPEAQFVPDLAPQDATQVVDMAKTIAEIENHYRYGIWNFNLHGEKPKGENSYANVIRWLVGRYGQTHGKSEILRWIDHQPGHVREIKLLKEHFPMLKIIHIVRDGRAVAASLLPLAWGPNAVLSAANYWAQRVAMGLALRDYLEPDCYIQVRYEDVVSDPQAELIRLCKTLDIPYSSAMLEGTGFAVPGFTKNQHQLVGSRPNSRRAEAWKSELSEREVEIFEALVGPLLSYLGYTLIHEGKARLPGFTEKTAMTITDQLKSVLNQKKFNRRVRQYTR